MCIDGPPLLFLDLRDQTSLPESLMLIRPCLRFTRTCVQFGEIPYLQLGEGEFSQVSWQNNTGASLSACPLNDESANWQLCYRCPGPGEDLDLLALFLEGIEDFTDNGFDAFDSASKTNDMHALGRAIDAISGRPRRWLFPEGYAAIGAAMMDHLRAK